MEDILLQPRRVAHVKPVWLPQPLILNTLAALWATAALLFLVR